MTAPNDPSVVHVELQTIYSLKSPRGVGGEVVRWGTFTLSSFSQNIFHRTPFHSLNTSYKIRLLLSARQSLQHLQRHISFNTREKNNLGVCSAENVRYNMSISNPLPLQYVALKGAKNRSVAQAPSPTTLHNTGLSFPRRCRNPGSVLSSQEP